LIVIQQEQLKKNGKRDNFEMERGEDKRCPKERYAESDPAGYI
jgi:hypothetical protein